MKKRLSTLLMTSIILIGCQGDFSASSTPYHNNGLVSLYLVDENGHAYSNIPYLCKSMTRWDKTSSHGEFKFLPPESCKFDLIGLNGNYGDRFDEVVRVVDYRDNGQSNIDYDCRKFGVGSTDYDGAFDYNIDDECRFYL